MGDWLGVIFGLLQTYFIWKQNKIFEKQNEIFAYQAEKGTLNMPDQAPRIVKVKRYWPMAAMALMTVATWCAVGFAYYQHVYNPAPILDFDQPQAGPALSSYGMDSPDSCMGTANGNSLVLAAHQANYRVAIACFAYDGKEDILDAPKLQVSRLYDIKPGLVIMRASYSTDFLQYEAAMHSIGIEVALFLVPDGVDISQISTLREARNLKVHILNISVALGGVVPNQNPSAVQPIKNFQQQ